MYQVLHPEQNRLLSVREYARSQGFRCVELIMNQFLTLQPELLSAMTLSLPARSETNTERLEMQCRRPLARWVVCTQCGEKYFSFDNHCLPWKGV